MPRFGWTKMAEINVQQLQESTTIFPSYFPLFQYECADKNNKKGPLLDRQFGFKDNDQAIVPV